MTIRDIVIALGFEIDKNAEKKVNDSIDGLKSFASETLEKIGVGYEVDESTKKEVKRSIEDVEKAAKDLEENEVGFDVDRRSENEVRKRIKALRSFAIKALGAIGIGLSIAAIGRLSEEFGGVNDRIRDATRGMGEQHEIQQRILRAANDTRQGYAAMADTITRLVDTRAFGGIEDAAEFATLMAKDFAAAGMGAEQSAGLMQQITMSLQQGTVDARALRMMFSESPATVNMLADSLGVSTYALQDMAKRGEISAESLRDAFTSSADGILERFGELDLTVSDALRNVRNQWGFFVSEMDGSLGISRAVARGIVNGFGRVLFMLRRTAEMMQGVVERLGGVRNAMRLLTIVAGALMSVMAAYKIMKFVKILQKADKALLKLKLKLAAIAVVIILLALLIEDFIAFMRGEDSLMGELLEKFGIDADGVREILGELWETIKGVIPFVMELAKAVGGLLLDALKMLLPILMNLLRQILPMVFRIVKAVLPLLIGVLDALIRAVFPIIEKILPIVINLIEEWLSIVAQVSETVLPIVIGLVEMLIDKVLPFIETILPILISNLRVLGQVVTFAAELLGKVLGAAFDGIRPIINASMQILAGFIDFIAGVFTGDWARAWEGIKNIFEGIVSGLVAVFKLPLNVIITGLNTFIGGLNRIRIPDWVPGVGGRGIDIPKIPMLASGSDFSPDTFIAGEEGPELITNAKGSKVFTAAQTADTLGKLNALANWKPPALIQDAKQSGGKGAVGWMRDLISAIKAPALGAAEVLGGSVEYKYITQYNEFYSEFHGDRAGQEKSAQAMDGAAEDATGQLARALAYVR